MNQSPLLPSSIISLITNINLSGLHPIALPCRAYVLNAVHGVWQNSGKQLPQIRLDFNDLRLVIPAPDCIGLPSASTKSRPMSSPARRAPVGDTRQLT